MNDSVFFRFLRYVKSLHSLTEPLNKVDSVTSITNLFLKCISTRPSVTAEFHRQMEIKVYSLRMRKKKEIRRCMHECYPLPGVETFKLVVVNNANGMKHISTFICDPREESNAENIVPSQKNTNKRRMRVFKVAFFCNARNECGSCARALIVAIDQQRKSYDKFSNIENIF